MGKVTKGLEVIDYPKGKDISIDLGYYEGKRIRIVEKVTTVAAEKELREFYSDPKVKEEAFNRILIKRGLVKVEEPKQDEKKKFAEYAVDAVERICNGRLKGGKMLPGTKIGHISDTRYITNYFSGRKNKYINELTVEDIKTFLDDFAKTHMSVTMEKAVRILRWTFEKAVEDKLIEKNIMKDESLEIPYGVCKIKPPSKTGKVEIYTDAELKKLRDMFKSNIYLSTFMLLLEKAGIRVSEALALKVKDIDFVNKQLEIYEAFTVCEHKDNTEKVAIKRDMVLGHTKNKEARKIDIPVVLCDKLKEYIEFSDNNKAIKNARSRNGLIFLTEDGKKQTVAGLRGRYRRVLEKNKSDINFGFHRFRHTYGTKAAEDGIDPGLLQYYMGHKDIKITYEYYITVTKKMRKKGAEIVEGWGNQDDNI